jgi:hypothetical protein
LVVVVVAIRRERELKVSFLSCWLAIPHKNTAQHHHQASPFKSISLYVRILLVYAKSAKQTQQHRTHTHTHTISLFECQREMFTYYVYYL